VSTLQEHSSTNKDKELKAFVSLLQDSEDKTLNLLADQISNFDFTALKQIDKIARQSNNEELIDNWFYVSRKNLRKELEAWRQDPELELGLLLLSKLKTPALDIQHYRTVLDEYAKRVSDKITTESSSLDIIHALNYVLFHEENYVGNQISYYDLSNNFLNTVIEGKTGNPIMLSSIYILVARRLGLEIESIGTPGHFIVKFDGMLIDPFFQGREVTKDECIIRAQELSVFWRDEYLDPIDDSMVLGRCIRNLIAIYKKLNDLESAADASDFLKLL